MENDESHYPHRAADRRLRSRARSNYSDRRQDPRFGASFPVEIHVGAGTEKRVYAGTASDVSNGGLLLQAPTVPATETRFRVEFRLPHGSMPEEYLHAPVSVDAEVRYRGDAGIGVRFTEPMAQRLARSTWKVLRPMAQLILTVGVIAILFIKFQNARSFWFDAPVFSYSLLVGFYLLSRFLFAAFYRTSAPLSELPTATVIVPAYNEQDHIQRTLTQLMESDYPADKLQVITVNDGSTDGTLAAIQRARERYPEIVLINLEASAGKRKALSAGIQIATGEIVVFIDSDSFADHDALRNLMNRFKDPEVAAVTGHCDVENVWTNVLTRMQAVRYHFAFRVIKAAESVFGAVTCLSGPIAAYRRTVLLQVVDEWASQRFLGKPATLGDDRSLTTSLLKLGHKTVYEEHAHVTTIVPDTYGPFMRQQLRWKRSWFRESLRAGTYMWRREPLVWLSYYLGFLLPIIGPFVVIRALLLVPLVSHTTPLAYLAGIFLMSCLMSSTYLFIKRSRLWLYGIVFCFFYLFFLIWQLPWAILTFWHSEWGTREENHAAKSLHST